MKIEHLAIWTRNMETLRNFYVKYFCCHAGEMYFNPRRHFTSCFLRFDSGARLEIMQMPGVTDPMKNAPEQFIGLAHFAVSTGSKHNVDRLTDQLRKDGYTVAGEPRTTGDGYYESAVLDPEGNLIEITV